MRRKGPKKKLWRVTARWFFWLSHHGPYHPEWLWPGLNVWRRSHRMFCHLRLSRGKRELSSLRLKLCLLFAHHDATSGRYSRPLAERSLEYNDSAANWCELQVELKLLSLSGLRWPAAARRAGCESRSAPGPRAELPQAAGDPSSWTRQQRTSSLSSIHNVTEMPALPGRVTGPGSSKPQAPTSSSSWNLTPSQGQPVACLDTRNMMIPLIARASGPAARPGDLKAWTEPFDLFSWKWRWAATCSYRVTLFPDHWCQWLTMKNSSNVSIPC